MHSVILPSVIGQYRLPNLINLLKQLDEQTYQNFELVFVDDSKEQDFEPFEYLSKIKSRVVRRGYENAYRHASARNFGIDNSSADDDEIILITQDAACLPENWVERHISYLSELRSTISWDKVIYLVGRVVLPNNHDYGELWPNFQKRNEMWKVCGAANISTFRSTFRKYRYDEIFDGSRGGSDLAFGILLQRNDEIIAFDYDNRVDVNFIPYPDGWEKNMIVQKDTKQLFLEYYQVKI